MAVAVAITRSEGLDRLTMRRLAKELDTGAASLYVYVADIEELHAAVLDDFLGEVEVGRAEGDWRERLRALMHSHRAVLFAQPSLARVALVTRMSGPRYLRAVDAALGLLVEGGLSAYGAGLAVDQLFLQATASAVEHGTRARTPNAHRQHEDLIAEIDAAPAEEYPNIARIGRLLVAGTPRRPDEMVVRRDTQRSTGDTEPQAGLIRPPPARLRR
ncbi:TetR/AcrR family transcriptional regulator [Amycolatopsis benzoatilytica]|uniref:TetR/AcrR family transcriptional regulator n=1 Tax=Amycolatopsis benzoatilytica TaxID=346045 RepID=UPI0003A14E21|nr:TetR/AcrR family transcriptional regulator C-terminal domain-containing protein [Amycolatopsis benzoatilytica]